MYNFYSSSDEILRTYDKSEIFFDDAGAFTFTHYAWVKQEKYKGLAQHVKTEYAGATSNFFGYSVNDAYSEHWISSGDPATKKIKIIENGVEKEVETDDKILSISLIDKDVFVQLYEA